MHIMKLFVPLERYTQTLAGYRTGPLLFLLYYGTYIYMASALGLGFIFRISLLILLALDSLVAPRHFSLYICIGSIYISFLHYIYRSLKVHPGHL